jgi:hypothetical protein
MLRECDIRSRERGMRTKTKMRPSREERQFGRLDVAGLSVVEHAGRRRRWMDSLPQTLRRRDQLFRLLVLLARIIPKSQSGSLSTHRHTYTHTHLHAAAAATGMNEGQKSAPAPLRHCRGPGLPTLLRALDENVVRHVQLESSHSSVSDAELLHHAPDTYAYVYGTELELDALKGSLQAEGQRRHDTGRDPDLWIAIGRRRLSARCYREDLQSRRVGTSRSSCAAAASRGGAGEHVQGHAVPHLSSISPQHVFLPSLFPIIHLATDLSDRATVLFLGFLRRPCALTRCQAQDTSCFREGVWIFPWALAVSAHATTWRLARSNASLGSGLVWRKKKARPTPRGRNTLCAGASLPGPATTRSPTIPRLRVCGPRSKSFSQLRVAPYVKIVRRGPYIPTPANSNDGSLGSSRPGGLPRGRQRRHAHTPSVK